MECDQVQKLLPAYIDGELDLVTALAVEEHLQTCPDCSRKYAELMDLQTTMAGSAVTLYQPAPAGLHKQIMSSLKKAEKANREPPAWLFFPWRQLAAAAFMLAVIALAVGLAGRWFPPSKNDLLAQEVLSAHVRSLMANHLMDIPSTDQHTVKPWFDGKLDFSPPIEDLAAQGFPLVGGRLDYLDGHSAAALVYHRNKHVINLFIWPSTDTTPGVRSSSDNGYNLYQWNQAGMAYWAVSDLNPNEMQSFVALVQKNFK